MHRQVETLSKQGCSNGSISSSLVTEASVLATMSKRSYSSHWGPEIRYPPYRRQPR
jgi:hypothetical protein